MTPEDALDQHLAEYDEMPLVAEEWHDYCHVCGHYGHVTYSLSRLTWMCADSFPCELNGEEILDESKKATEQMQEPVLMEMV